MPSTYTLISSNVLASSAASVTFSAIPSTYTDLVLRFSTRTDAATTQSQMWITINGLTTSIYSFRRFYGTGTAVSNEASAATLPDNVTTAIADGANATASTFANGEIYIPSYTVAQNKPFSSISSQENNLTAAYTSALAGLISSTASVTSLSILTPSNFVSGSSFYLYGIKNS